MTGNAPSYAVSWPLAHDAAWTIGVLGDGPLALFIARRAAAAAVDVLAGVAEPDAAWRTLADGSDGRLRLVSRQEALTPEIVILAVAWREMVATVSLLADWEARILVDATNRDDDRQMAGASQSSLLVRDLAANAYLVKALNFAEEQLDVPSRIAIGRRACFVSGDDGRAKSEVCRLLDHIGFAAVDLGLLMQGAPLQCVPGGVLGESVFIRPD